MSKHVDGMTTKRTLDLRMRRVVIDGALAFFSREGEGAKDQKGPAKYQRICRILDEDELTDQELALDSDLQADGIAYREALQAIDSGVVERDGNGRAIVPLRPRMDETRARGEAREFAIPNGIDSAIREVLKAQKSWHPSLLRYVESAKAAFGVADDDKDFLTPEEREEAAPAPEEKKA